MKRATTIRALGTDDVVVEGRALKRFLIQLYRVSPGDVGIPDLAATANTFREAERQAIRHLET
jgi:hypothetical protein